LTAKHKFEAPTWNQIYDMLLKLADKIRSSGFKPDVIVGVCRGGWPPARVLSDLLGNPNLANVRVEFYVGVAETNHTPVLTQPISVNTAGKKVLIVDEVADTGESLKLVRDYMLKQGANEVKIATIYSKPWSIVKPDYCEKETRSWIVFPWEAKETVRKIVKKCRENGESFETEKANLVEAGVAPELVEKFLKEISEEEKC